MIDKVSKRSGELFESGFYCAESVLLAISEAKDIKSSLIPRIATGFCSGLARTCGMCGAVSGAIIAINIIKGRNVPEESVDDNYETVRKFVARFEDKYGFTNCKELIGCDLGTDEGQKTFQENNLKEKCLQFTEEAARMAMKLIQE